MITEYKLYHGAVLAELVCEMSVPFSIDELAEQGRLSSYILDGRIGLHVKHSTQRLSPWSFTFTVQNNLDLMALSEHCHQVYIVLVCSVDGMVCLSFPELAQIVAAAGEAQSWIRVTRRKGKWFSLTGPSLDRPTKRPEGLATIVRSLNSAGSDAPPVELAESRPSLMERVTTAVFGT